MSSPSAQPSDRLLFLSLKPRFAELIINGTKSIELRRRPPRLTAPTPALLYATSPAMQLVGVCQVEEVVSHAPPALWAKLGSRTGISRRDFDDYFQGTDRAYALLLSNPRRLDEPVDLAALRIAIDGFTPPQSFRYLDTTRASALPGLQHA